MKLPMETMSREVVSLPLEDMIRKRVQAMELERILADETDTWASKRLRVAAFSRDVLRMRGDG